MTHPDPPIDDELARLFESERSAKAPEDALVRVWSRLVVATPPPNAPHASGATKAAAHGWLASHALGVALGSFVAGVATGVALHAALQTPPQPRIVLTERPATSPPSAPPQASTSPPWTEASAAPSIVAPAPSTHRASAPASASSTDSLRTERDALDRARHLLTTGDPDGALTVLDDHATHFPKPQLAEEREALAIQSLVALRRYDQARARARAARLREGSPRSLFMPVIESALGSIP